MTYTNNTRLIPPDKNRDKQESNKHLILRLLDMSGEAYELQLFESAFAYLEMRHEYINEDDRATLVQNKLFWVWWTNQWERRNNIVLNQFNYTDVLMVPSDGVRKRARMAYDTMHEVSAMNFMINRFIVRSTFEMTCKLSRLTPTLSKGEGDGQEGELV